MVDSIQDTYEDQIPVSYPGVPYDLTDRNAYGRSAEASGLRFGAAVIQGTHDNQVRLPDDGNQLLNGATTGIKFRGIVTREHVTEQGKPALASPIGNGESSYISEFASASIQTHGRIYVVVEHAVAPTDPVFFRRNVGTLSAPLGGFRKDADTGNAEVITNARFVTSAIAGGLAVVELSTSI